MPCGPPSENRASMDISAWTKDVADFNERQPDIGENGTAISNDVRPTYPRRSYVPEPRVDLAQAAFPFQEEQNSGLHPYSRNDGRPISLPPAYSNSENNSARSNVHPISIPLPHPYHPSQHPELALPPPSRLAPGDMHGTFLPTYNRPPSPPEEDIPEETGLLGKVKAFWKRITTEPPLPSPPPSEASTSRCSSFDGERPPGFTKDDLVKLAEYDHDLFLRAMQLSRKEDDFSNGPVDAETQGFGVPNPSHEFVFANPGKLDKKLSYKERREQMKHRIIYNKDSAF